MKKILFVTTSHSRIGDTLRETGVWFDEFAAPYIILSDAGFDITTASPDGGTVPVDPESMKNGSVGPEGLTFLRRGIDVLSHALPLSKIKEENFDAVFYPGGHGPLWDLAYDETNASLLEKFVSSGKTVAAVCHGPAALLRAKRPDGKSIIDGKRLTGFSDREEVLCGLSRLVPFMLEDNILSAGGLYTNVSPWREYTVTDGWLITGQNPQSSSKVAYELMKRF